MNRTASIGLWLLGVSACFSSGDKAGDGNASGGTGRDTAQAAAQDLTSALMLAGGEVVDGDIPAADATGVTVMGNGDTLTLVPGEADILPLGVDNPDEDTNPVGAVLLQFEGADDHIRADATSMGGMVASMYSVGGGACDKLCNKVYKITMYEAVALEDGSVSERAVQTIDLDCREHGDPKLCGDGAGGSGGGGGTSTSGGSGGTGAMTVDPNSAAGMLQNSLMALSNEICKCLGGACTPEQSLELDLDCSGAAFAMHESESKAYLECMNDQVQSAAACVVAAACDTTMIESCSGQALDDAIMTTCGARPTGFDADTGACSLSADAGVGGSGGTPSTGGTGGTGGGCAADEFECDDASCIPSSWACDGADDCSKGEDEQGCP